MTIEIDSKFDLIKVNLDKLKDRVTTYSVCIAIIERYGITKN